MCSPTNTKKPIQPTYVPTFDGDFVAVFGVLAIP